MNVLVTGASGYLGESICRALLTTGDRPVGLVRASSRTEALQSSGVTLRVADLATGDGLQDALEGVDAVVHAAGGGWVRRPSDFHRNNAETTRILMESMANAALPPRRIVFLSSVAAHGPSGCVVPATESDADAPVSAYGKSKKEAERLIASLRRPEVSGFILRPPAIYGPGDTRLLPLFRSIERGVAALPATAESTSLLHVDDLVTATLAALTTPVDGVATRYVAGQKGHTWDAIVDTVEAHLQVRARRVRIPLAVFRAAGWWNDKRAALLNRAVLLTSDKVHDMRAPCWVFDSSMFSKESGWRAAMSLDEGIRSTIQDYRARGWLRSGADA